MLSYWWISQIISLGFVTGSEAGHSFQAPKVAFSSTRKKPPSFLWNSGSRLLCLFVSQCARPQMELELSPSFLWDKMAYSSPYLREISPSSFQTPFWWPNCSPQPLVHSLSLHPVSPSISLAAAELMCVPGGSFGASHPACIFLLYSLAYSLRTIVWIVMHFGLRSRLSKACFQLNKPKERKQLRPLLLYSHYPSQQGGRERMHPLGPKRMSNIRPFSINYTA